jgi:hypothetical protein
MPACPEVRDWRRPARVAFVALAVASLGIAGCSTNSNSDTPTPAASPTMSSAGQFGTALSVAVLTTVQVQLVDRALADGLTDPVEISTHVLVPMALASAVVMALLLVPISRLRRRGAGPAEVSPA